MSVRLRLRRYYNYIYNYNYVRAYRDVSYMLVVRI